MPLSQACRAIAGTFLCLATSACAGGGVPDPYEGRAQGPRHITIQVRNDNFSDATLIVFRDGERVQVGVVTGKTREEFYVQWTAVRLFRAQLDLLAGGSCFSREAQVEPGELIQIDVPVETSNDPRCRNDGRADAPGQSRMSHP